jgi:hypothetical protein
MSRRYYIESVKARIVRPCMSSAAPGGPALLATRDACVLLKDGRPAGQGKNALYVLELDRHLFYLHLRA